MPCDDISEIIELELDRDDRLRDYRLNKRTCGAQVGLESLLGEFLRGKGVDEILAFHTDDIFLLAQPAPDEEFLVLKHLIALQEALGVVVGREAGTPDQPCAAAQISADDDGIRFTGVIAIDLLNARIRACGHCGSCGTGKKSRLPLAALP